jgi:hypothetical protein
VPTVTVTAGYSKRRREDVLPLRADTAAELRGLLANKLPDTKAFNMSAAGGVARPMNPERTTIVATYGIIWINCATDVLP